MTEATTTPWRDDPVPPAWRGLWRRLSLETPDGGSDLATEVLWMQTEHHQADIRVPAGCPSVDGARDFADLTADQLDALACYEGFAGGSQWDGDRLAWRRWIDFNPPGGPPDEGVLRPSSPRVLVEDGLHVPYVEHWWHERDGRRWPLRAEVTRTPRPRLTLACGDAFFFCEDRRPAPPPPGGLREAVAEAAAARDVERVRTLLDCEISFGRIDQGGAWIITRSTLPWRQGRTLTPSDGGD